MRETGCQMLYGELKRSYERFRQLRTELVATETNMADAKARIEGALAQGDGIIKAATHGYFLGQTRDFRGK